MKSLPILIASAIASGLSLSAHAQLLDNGDFETPPFTELGTVTDWTVVGNCADIEQGHTSGSHCGALSAGGDFEGDMLSQSFPTIAGKVYTLDFDASIFGFEDSGATLRLRVEVFPTASTVDETITPTPSHTFNPNLVDWDHYQYTFTATSTTTTLRFTSIGMGNAVADQVVDTVIILPPALQLQTAASVKLHGSPGTEYAVNLPLTGQAGVECRQPNPAEAHTLIFTFTNNIVSGSASVTDGIGTPGTPAFVNNTMTVQLSGVDDQQEITVTLSSVTDEFGQVLPDKSVKMNVLLGDTTADISVNSADISQTKSQSGSAVDGLNFREDMTCDNSIDSADISLVKSRSGNGIVSVLRPGFGAPETTIKKSGAKFQRGRREN